MLTDLLVKNFALIEEIRLEFGSGFSVISGETGAGKSILVGALGFLLGGKAQASMIRTGAEEAVVEAAFSVKKHPTVREYLEDAGLDEGDQLLIRRQIVPGPRSRIFINGKSVTLSQLQAVTSQLVDLSGQHEQQILLQEDHHRKILDFSKGAGGSSMSSLLEDYQKVYQPYKSVVAEMEQKQREVANRESRLDFLKYQLKEIEAAEITDVGEEDKLVGEKERVKNADFLFELAKSGQELSGAKLSAMEQVDSLILRLEKGVEVDPSLNEGLSLLQQVRELLEENSHFFARYGQGINVDSGRLEKIESRLYQLYQLRKKYGEDLAAVLDHYQKMKEEWTSLENFDDFLKQKSELKDKLASQVLRVANQLSTARQKNARLLEKKIQKELTDLSMRGVIFYINVRSPESPTIEDCGPTGFNQVCFDFSANAGEKPRGLAQVASGGELSRVLLALKRVLGHESHAVIYIFDEIDSGIGGGVAEVVGRKLKEIAQNHQVLCVTHLPQVAAFAEGHFVIEKSQSNRRTSTGVRRLGEAKDRETEIARMLGGVTLTNKTKAHAQEMIKMAQGN